MKNYSRNHIPKNEIKFFTINLGLLPGYDGKNEFSLEKVVELIETWNRQQEEKGVPSFPLKITPISFVYRIDGKTINESAIEIHGEIIEKYYPEIFHSDEQLLNEISLLASFLGNNLKQKRVHIKFNGEKYILE